ncbi:hypothetical protein HK102_007207 [Quaeritorhiza haematococci]|nr:hypothetical protein HK102_007207 [Quaeritorhiza haematococci]
MGSSSRRQLCGCLFWTKVLIALLLSLAIMGYMSLLIYQRRDLALKNRIGSPDNPIFDFDNPAVAASCAAQPSTFQQRVINGQTFNVSQGGVLEPPDNVMFWGFHLDWSLDTPQRLTDRLGNRPPAIINAFVQINNTDLQRDMINWFAIETAKVKAMLELTVMVNVPITTITNDTLLALAEQMRYVNSVYGVPVILRFCHEMNGNWMLYYGMKPFEYVSTWRILYTYVHARTNLTAMLWNPNTGRGYPYTNPFYDEQVRPRPGDRNFALLDTNNNGQIDVNDDPYGPYWPGAEYVDWVGMSLYLYETNAAGLQTVVAPANYISDQINSNARPDLQFYNRFSDAFAKPMAFGETGAAVFTRPGANQAGITVTPPSIAEELAIKSSWWRQLFEVSEAGVGTGTALFPNLKAFVHFEEAKDEEQFAGGQNVVVFKDYRITEKPQIANQFIQDIEQRRVFYWADQLNYTCSGIVSINP